MTMRSLKQLVKRLHKSEQGAEGLEKLLIVGAIVIPLLAVLILFRNAISEWATEMWEDVRADAETPSTGPQP